MIFSLGMVMNATVFGACAVSFAMKMLMRDPPEAEKKEILDEAGSHGEYEDLPNGLREELEDVKEITAILMNKEAELEIVKEENLNLRSKVVLEYQKIAGFEDSLVKMQDQLKEAYAKFEEANDRERETLEKLRLANLELEDSKERATIALEQLEAVRAAKLAMETEMEQNRIQTEQCKKAADAAATVLQATAQNGESSGKLMERSASTNIKRHAMLRNVGRLFKKKDCV